VRPFFLTPDGRKPTAYKPYYDFLSYIVTQTAFCFTTAPFVLLTFSDSFLVWTDVYYFPVIGVILSMAFFASPAKGWLIQQQKARQIAAEQKTGVPAGHDLKRVESEHGTTLGMPNDPGRDIDEVINEVMEQMEARRRRGEGMTRIPGKEDVAAAMREKLHNMGKQT